MTLNYVLVTEGRDDRMLHAPIDWLLSQHCQVPFSGIWANPTSMSDSSRILSTRLSQTALFYPCQLAFVHRDTDTTTVAARVAEITCAATDAGYPSPMVCVVPVRMTEAWFLFNEQAIRKAAGNPSSAVPLNLPDHNSAQRRADPKNIIEQALLTASEATGRKLKQFRADISTRKSLVSSYIDDFSPLRNYGAFVAFEQNLAACLAENGW